MSVLRAQCLEGDWRTGTDSGVRCQEAGEQWPPGKPHAWAQDTAVLFVLHWVLTRAADFVVLWDRRHGCCMTVGIYMAVSICTW